MKNKTTVTITASVIAVAGLVSVLLAFRSATEQPRPKEEELRWVEVDEVDSGHKVELESGEKLVYAGIRCPYLHEPMYQEARRRNVELVKGKELRLRFDDQMYDRKQRLVAYVSVDGTFVNETLVREGLAYVRASRAERRFAERLIEAQKGARSEKRGLWAERPRPSRGGYLADPKYGNFHNIDCEEVPNMKPDRRVHFSRRDDAFDRGFAPCPKCRP